MAWLGLAWLGLAWLGSQHGALPLALRRAGGDARASSHVPEPSEAPIPLTPDPTRGTGAHGSNGGKGCGAQWVGGLRPLRPVRSAQPLRVRLCDYGPVCVSRSAAGRIEPRRSDVGLVAQRDRLPRRDRADGERLTAVAVAVAVALRLRRRSQVSFFEAVQRCSALETINLSGNRTFSLDVKARPASPSGRPSLWHSYTVQHSQHRPSLWAKPSECLSDHSVAVTVTHSALLGSTPSASRCPHRPPDRSPRPTASCLGVSTRALNYAARTQSVLRKPSQACRVSLGTGPAFSAAAMQYGLGLPLIGSADDGARVRAAYGWHDRAG